tara:strand:+ start:1147 stop:2919 length:1773 start_codon:yes stop_codon:yes gene_type:complete
MQTFKRLLGLITHHERKRAVLLLGMILIMALIDMIGIASILPFMAVLTNPNIIEMNNSLNTLFEASKILGIENKQEFLFALGLLVFILLITSLSVRAITTYVQLRFIQMLEYSMTKRLIEGYLHQPYSWFLSRHSADIGKNVLSEVAVVIGGGIKPIIEIIAKGMVAIALITLLFLVNPKLTLIIGLSLGGAYTSIFYFIRSYLKKIGKKRLINNELRFKSVIEAFGATKEVKVGGLEQTYVERFSGPSYIFAKTQASLGVIAQLPRFFLEAIAFGGVLLVILYMMAQSGNFGTALPILSLYVFAGYRLMPALQQIYSSFTQLAFVGPSLEKLHEDIKSLKPFNENQDQSVLSFNKSITLKNIYYNYPNESRTVLNDINLTIPVKSTVGFVGTTGSGKTTIVDIILGLLQTKKGTLEVDGQIITKKNTRAWQRIIGYVPQHIYLIDDTIAANISFGVKPEDVSQEAVEIASKIANLHDFVMDELTNQYQTKIGERGVRLSGGQIQRIGIARALYHNPQVLVLDEATSALDNVTEQAVVEAINNLSKKITVILIAHRLNTLKNCDMIFKLEKGKLVDQGPYDEINTNKNSS